MADRRGTQRKRSLAHASTVASNSSRRTSATAFASFAGHQESKRPPILSTFAGRATMADHCDRPGAVHLKERIESYWRERGGAVAIELVEAEYIANMRSARVDVRSDMLNGWPREWIE